MLTTPQNIPAGLTNDSVEFFIDKGEIYCLANGKVHTWANIPSRILKIVRDNLQKNEKALKALKSWGITDEEAKLKQYISCRFGAFDHKADITNGKISHTEYVACERRGQCPHEGKLCAPINVAHGELSRTEVKVLKLIGEGKMDKDIATELGVSKAAIRNHKDKIGQKARVARKMALAVLAHQLNLIQ